MVTGWHVQSVYHRIIIYLFMVQRLPVTAATVVTHINFSADYYTLDAISASATTMVGAVPSRQTIQLVKTYIFPIRFF